MRAIVLWIGALVITFALVVPAMAGMPKKPTRKDKCQVCGMYVYKYPDWVSVITFTDGAVTYFDGAKDMFTYFLNPGKDASYKATSEVENIYVTEYYGLSMIPASEAWFVTGGDVFGPMGHELIPFKSKSEALEFMLDHKGKQVLKFNDVTPAIIKGIK
jgi:copper chaperone NosL